VPAAADAAVRAWEIGYPCLEGFARRVVQRGQRRHWQRVAGCCHAGSVSGVMVMLWWGIYLFVTLGDGGVDYTLP
jgi:hypothetical protein